MSDDEFAQQLSEAIWLRHYERELMEAAFADSLRKVLGEVLSKRKGRK